MKMTEKRKHLAILVILIPLLAGLTLSCVDTKDEIADPDPVVIKVTANLSDIISSRAYNDDPVTVEYGIYNLSYPTTENNIYAVGSVDFAKNGVTPGIGIVTLPSAGNEELVWKKVGGIQPTFYLDNVAATSDNPEDPMIVEFSEANPYKASLYNGDAPSKKEEVIDEKGSNDLLWGSKTVIRSSNTGTETDPGTINFDLHHNMSRFKVEITVNQENGPINMEGATVVITDLAQTPESYNRIDGTLNLGEKPDYSPITLINSNGDDGLTWASSIDDDNNGNITIYTTRDFVIAPQTLKENETRPRLVITLSNGDVYSGIIPYAMTVVDSTHPEGYPMTLSFLKEHILTIRTIVTEDPPELVFMPVYVVEWVDKGVFSLDGHENGIYSSTEFDKLIEYYQDKDKYYQLNRYGNLKDDKWQFVFWNYVELEESRIRGKMIPDPGPAFSFYFNGFTVMIRDKNGIIREITAEELYNIVTGKN